MKRICYILIFIGLFFGANYKSLAQKDDVSFTIQNQISMQHDAVLYPNPVTDCKFKVKSEQIIDNVDVVNVIGQSVFSIENKNHTSEDIFIQLPDCEKGMYLVKIKFEDSKSIIKKLLVK